MNRDHISSRRYWDIPVRVAAGDEASHAARLRQAFLETLRKQTAPYQRIGISLSGGLDSAIVAAGVRTVAGDREVHTISAGYGPDDTELANAETVAKVLDTVHHPVVLDPADLPGLLPWMVWHLEEPIGREDIAYLFVAAREAARYVDLVVTGFGFDGLFAGLPRHRLGGPRGQVSRSSEDRSRNSSTTTCAASSRGRSAGGASFVPRISAGKDFPAPKVIGADPLPPFAGFPRDEDQPLTNFLRRGFLVLPYQHPVERLYAGAGLRMNAQHTDPDFLGTAFSIPDRLKIHGRTQKYILRRACEGLLPPDDPGHRQELQPAEARHEDERSAGRHGRHVARPATFAERGLFEPAYVSRLRARAYEPAVQPGARLPALVAAAHRAVGADIPRPKRRGSQGATASGQTPVR